MKKNYKLFLLLPILLLGTKINAQVALTNFLVNNSTSALPVNSSSQTVSFYVLASKDATLGNEGVINIHLGDAAGNLNLSPLNISPHNTANGWGSATGGKVYQDVAGNFQISASVLGTYRMLYAVYTDNITNVKTKSSGIAVSIVPDPPVNTGECPVQQICSDQCVPSGTQPLEIRGGRLYPASEYPAISENVQWEFSYDNVHWNPIAGAVNQHYAPPIVYHTVYYRRVSTRLEPHWIIFKKRRYYYTTNTVTITSAFEPPTVYCNR